MNYFGRELYPEQIVDTFDNHIFERYNVLTGSFAVRIYQYQWLLLPYGSATVGKGFASGFVDEPCGRQFSFPI
jgi:hypothetical protein